MTDAMRSFHELHTAMQSAGMLDEEPHLCDGCDRTDHPVTASPDGRALLCPDCQARLAAQEEPARTPALQQLATWHAPDCDKQCGGTCTHGAAEIIANAVGVPVEAITGPSPDGLPDHWRDAAPPIDTTTLPACPLDGQPLLQTYAAANQPTLYRHADGTIHPDRTAEIVASAVGAPVETVTESSPDDLGFPSHWRNPAVPTGQHVPTDLEVTAHIPPYTEYIPQRGPIEYPRSEELQAAAHVGNSCATCWPRPCDPTRSECRRHASGTDNPT
jgi:bacterioferritin-associated ferredoxin